MVRNTNETKIAVIKCVCFAYVNFIETNMKLGLPLNIGKSIVIDTFQCIL